MTREAFEAWFSDQGRFPRACEKGRDGSYLLQHANTSWIAWQAARAAALEEAARKVENYCGAWDDEGYALAMEIRALKEKE